MTGSAGPLLVIAAGGTGGHMFPAQALSEAMLARGWRVRLMTDVRGARYAGGFSHAVQVVQVASATTARGGLADRVRVPFLIGRGVLSAMAAFRRERPGAVVGFGGYPTIPALSAAVLMRLPRMIHEQNGVLGRVNTAFARRVDLVACGTWPTAVPEGARAEHTGNPVRGAIRDRAGAPYIPPGEHPMMILVIGGSQGARILSDVVPGAIAALPEAVRRWVRVAHQARDEDVARVTDAYARAGIDAEVKPFFQDIPRRMAEAQLVVSRAGASSVADLCAIGRPAILVPFAAATADHQTANARGMVEGGAAILIPEGRLDITTLAEHMAAVLGQPQAAVRMAHGALALARLDATDRLAGLVLELAGRGRGTP